MPETEKDKQSVPIPSLTEEKREEMAEVVARFIKARPNATSEPISQEIYAKAFDVAFLITSSFETNEAWSRRITRPEVVEAAVELLERAKKHY